jgi:hypothetical protein
VGVHGAEPEPRPPAASARLEVPAGKKRPGGSYEARPALLQGVRDVPRGPIQGIRNFSFGPAKEKPSRS